MAAWALVGVLLAGTIGTSVSKFLVARELRRFDGGREIAEYIASTLDEGKTIYVDVELISPRNLDVDIPQETERIRRYLTEKSGRNVEIKSTVIRADIIETRSVPPPRPPRA